jgi:hypothetical protein
MGITDKMWDAITTVIKMNDKVERMASAIELQQKKIEALSERVIRLEAALEMALSRPMSSRPTAIGRRGELSEP